ncbi:MAG: asparagine synthase-related protein [Parcubacteria group bacterium]|jgi:hypothetical protein
MNEYIKSGAYKWKVCVPLSCDSTLIECFGKACLEKRPDGILITVPSFQNGDNHILVSVDTQKQIKIHTFPVNIQRCYARIDGNDLILSNIAIDLFKKNEKIKIRGEVLLRQISNLIVPLDDLFVDVKLLDASSTYKIQNGKILFDESRIKFVKSATSSIQEYAFNSFENICKGGKPLAVLLSAGIDSRLNIALAYHFSKKYKNKIIAYHEYKDKKEYKIAKQVADSLKVPFVCVPRDMFREEPLKYVLSPEFIDFHGGIYRDTLIRWYSYMDLMRFNDPDCIIIGMGADAHKGRYYRDIHKLPEDANKILGYKLQEKNIRDEKDFMPYFSNELTNEFFSDITRRSLIFKSIHSRTDFIFYHVRTVKQSVSRTPFFHMNYGVQFPLKDDDFLSQAFSLPMKDKMDGAIPLRLIRKLNPKLDNIPYNSGNRKCYRRQYINSIRHRIKCVLSKFPDSDRRNEKIAWDHPMVLDCLNGASSEITAKLEKFIKENLGKKKPNGQIKPECALRVYLFLRQTEKKLGIEFICE